MQGGDSTTECSLSVRRGTVYQLMLKYKSKEEIASNWKDRRRDKINRREVVGSAGKPEREKHSDWTDSILRNEEAIRGYLDSEECRHLTDPENGVMSRVLVFSGRGEDAVFDRMLIRRILHLAQGLEDPATRHKLDFSPQASEASPAHPFFGTDEQALRWGVRTRFALIEIHLYVPCEMAPGRHGEWIDTAGVGDGDELKRNVVDIDLQRADAVIIVVKEVSAKASDAARVALRKCKPMKTLLDAMLEGGVDGHYDSRIAFLNVDEQAKPSSMRNLCQSNNETCQCDACKGMEIERTSYENSVQAVMDEARDAADFYGINVTPDRQKIKDTVTILRPFIMRFTSMMMCPSLKISNSDLEATDVYPLLWRSFCGPA